MIECENTVSYKDMVASESITGNDSLGVKIVKHCVPQKHAS